MICQLLKGREFVHSMSTISHDLSIMACEHGNTIHIVSVSQTTAPEEQIIGRECNLLFTLSYVNISFKLVDSSIWLLTHDFTSYGLKPFKSTKMRI